MFFGTYCSISIGNCLIVTPHAQRERGKVIGRGVHIYIYIYIYIYINTMAECRSGRKCIALK